MLKKLSSFFLDIIEVLVFAIAIFLFVYLLVLQPHKIKGQSMDPNFANGEYLLTDKITYRLRQPKRGDVIVFEAPGANGEEFIKRIIATPGEKIYLHEGNIFINGLKLIEPYLSESLYTSSGNFLREDSEIVIPENHYFVMGDNREASSDSRTWGLIDKQKITGKAWVIYWPPDKVGSIKEVTYNFSS